MDFVTEAVKHIREYLIFTRVRVPVSFIEEFERKMQRAGIPFAELEGSAYEVLYFVQAKKDDVQKFCSGRVRFDESTKRRTQHKRHYYRKANEKASNPMKQVRETDRK